MSVIRRWINVFIISYIIEIMSCFWGYEVILRELDSMESLINRGTFDTKKECEDEIKNNQSDGEFIIMEIYENTL